MKIAGHLARSAAAPCCYPRTLRIVDGLPKGPAGMILEREITGEPGR